ncbi:MAG: helix-turn-helix transcriptional regulator [Elusimicrobia bacterium]|nr:helix-turn-helix transcriptional regulator [Elusimicrobiota bacterium]
MAALLKKLREGRGISQRQLAEHAGVHASVVSRAERGEDAKLSTWGRLFEGLGYLLAEERDRRLDRRAEGLCAGKRRF